MMSEGCDGQEVTHQAEIGAAWSVVLGRDVAWKPESRALNITRSLADRVPHEQHFDFAS